MNRLTIRLLAAVAALLMCVAPPASAQVTTVFAAASLKEALDDVVRQFERGGGGTVAVSYAASSALAKQIEAGAPADLFISADTDWADYLAARHLLAPGSRINLLGNQLVLIAPAGAQTGLRISRGFRLAEALGDNRLAMANPDAVPAGKYGKAALDALGVWPTVAGKVARAENVRGALLLVSRGEAPFGIVYRTDALADRGVRIVDTFPAGSHPAIIYPLARVAGAKSSAAPALLAFMKSARATWEKYGFTVIE